MPTPDESLRSRRTILHNLGVLTIAQILTMLVSVAALVYIARTLGPYWFGVIQLGVAYLSYVLIIAEWGMGTLGVREVARLTDRQDVFQYSCVHLGLLGAMATTVLIIGLVTLPLFPFYSTDPWVFTLYLLVVIPHFMTQDWIGIGLERMTWVGVARTSRSAVYAVLVFLLLKPLDGVLGWPGYRWVPVLFWLAYALSTALMATGVRRWLGRWVRPAYGGRAEWRRRLSATAPIGAGLLTLRVLLNIDVIMLGFLVAPAVVGSYAAAAKIIFVLLIAVEVLWRALLPRLSYLWHDSQSLFRTRYNLYLGAAVAAFVPVAVGGALLGDRLMDLLYGHEYPGAGTVFRILSVSYAVLALGQFFGNGLIASDRQRAYFPPLLASALVAVAATALLIQRYGGVGAAYGMLMAHTSLFILAGWVSRKLLARSLWTPLGLAAFGAVLMAVFIRVASPLPLVVLVIVASLIYGLAVGPPLWIWARRQGS